MFIVMTDTFPGSWGRGETEVEARDECKRHGGKGPWLSLEIDPWWDSAWVGGLGAVLAACSEEKASVPREDRPPVVAGSWRLGVRGKRTAVTL